MKRLIKIGAVVVVLLVLIAVAIPFLINANQFKPLLESRLSAALGRTITIGDLKLNLWAGQVSAAGLTVGDDPAFGAEPFLTAAALNVGVELRPLIFDKQLNITGITLERPEVRVILNGAGNWNFSSLGGGGKTSQGSGSTTAPEFRVDRVDIRDGRFTLARSGTGKPLVFEAIDFSVTDLAPGKAFGFTLSAKRAAGGAISVEGKAGPLNSDGALPPLQAKFNIPNLDLNASGLIDASTGVGAVASLNGAISTNGNSVSLRGAVNAQKLKLVRTGSPAGRPVAIDFAIVHDVVRRSGKIERADLAIGSAKSTLRGTYSVASAVPSIALKYAGEKMPLTELAAMLPALDVVLPAGAKIEGGTLSIGADVVGSLARFNANGPIVLEDAKLANFDLGSRMRTVQALAGLPTSSSTTIETLSAAIRRTPEGTNIGDINMVVTGLGTLTGAGRISPGNDLDFDMSTTLKTSGELMRAIGQKGDTTVPFLIQGTAANPIFKPNVSAIAQKKVQQLMKDPNKTIDAARGFIDMFRRPKPDAPQQ